MEFDFIFHAISQFAREGLNQSKKLHFKIFLGSFYKKLQYQKLRRNDSCHYEILFRQMKFEFQDIFYLQYIINSLFCKIYSLICTHIYTDTYTHMQASNNNSMTYLQQAILLQLM